MEEAGRNEVRPEVYTRPKAACLRVEQEPEVAGPVVDWGHGYQMAHRRRIH